MEINVVIMVRIRVTPREIELLYLSYKTMNIPNNFTIEHDYIVIEKDELENLDIIFNCLLDTFVKIGLLDNDEPNAIGFELENLNQKINHEYVRLNK